MKKLVVSAAPIEKRIAAMEDDLLIDIEIVRPSEKVQVGDIYYGFIQKNRSKSGSSFC